MTVAPLRDVARTLVPRRVALVVRPLVVLAGWSLDVAALLSIGSALERPLLRAAGAVGSVRRQLARPPLSVVRSE